MGAEAFRPCECCVLRASCCVLRMGAEAFRPCEFLFTFSFTFIFASFRESGNEKSPLAKEGFHDNYENMSYLSRIPKLK
jgi:hypothetical protein